MLRRAAFSLSRALAGFEGSVFNELGNVGFATRVAASKSTAKKSPASKLKKETPSSKLVVKAPKPAPALKEVKEKKKAMTRRPLSAYAIFVKHEYPGIKEASPGKEFAEISKKIADLWKELPDDRRAKYLKEAEKHVAATKAVKKPKSPPNAYAVFAKETFPSVKQKYPGLAFTDVSRKVAQLWKTLPPLEKAARKDRYQKAMEAFKTKNANKVGMKV
ncbi:hypothetical protein BSKO_11622 [Bryopsis sp. KO-2023]|nr:hypothetical protein BSKO_11622 [Bryopsis sp. KO-2023]